MQTGFKVTLSKVVTIIIPSLT